MNIKTALKIKKAVIGVSAFTLVLAILAPFAWLAISSISTKAELLSIPIHWFPKNPTLINYKKLLSGGITSLGGGEIPPFKDALKNSIIVSGSVTFICLAIGSLAAYAFATMEFWLKKQMMLVVIAIRMLPEIALVLPLYMIMRKLGIMDTQLVLIIVYSSFILPFVIWIMKSYFQTIPKELYEAAYIDGCSTISTLWRIILPVSLPGIVTTCIFALLTAWDEFLFALILTSTYNAKTLPVAISEFTTRHMVDYGLMATGGLIAAIPPIIVALLLQKYVINGLTEGSVKG